MKNLVLGAIASVLLCGAAGASTVLTNSGGTLTTVGPGDTIYQEGGFTVSGINQRGYVQPGSIDIHFHDTHWITYGGSKFDVLSIDLDPSISYWGWDNGDGTRTLCELLCKDVSLIGYADGVEVARTAASSYVQGTLSFTDELLGIDRLVITMRNASIDFGPNDKPYTNDPQFLYDNLTIQPIPLPAGAVLLGGGILVLGAVRRRARRA